MTRGMAGGVKQRMARTLAWARRLWLGASPAWAVAETLLLAFAIVAWPLLSLALRHGEGWLRTAPTLALLVEPVCAVWCAARLRLDDGPWWRGLLRDGAIGGAIGLMPTGIIVLTLYALTLQPGAPRAFQLTVNRFPVAVFAAIWLLAFSLGFIGLRLIVRLLRYWDRLRRGSLRWSLTHAHLMIVVAGAGLVAVFALGALTLRGSATHNPLNFTYVAVAFLIFLAVLTGITLVVVLIPSALFSYLFVRPIARRIQALAGATGALRAGNLEVRVPVVGQDEVAQLQADFNAMAADLQRAMRDLQEERDNVATLLRARRELVASVSHELRTPVATLRGYLESTLAHWDGAPPEILRHDLGVMERETAHLQALISDLFTLARVEVGRLEMRPGPVDLVALTRHVVEAMGPLAWRSRRVEMVAEADGAAPLALADASRVEQVLQNLLHNAVRHTPPGGIVAVRVSATDAYTVGVHVEDTGEGIAPDDLPRIWERFYRATERGPASREREEDHEVGGTGLGLALVRELTEAMGGTVGVESALGEGSQFTIRLPRAAAVVDVVARDQDAARKRAAANTLALLARGTFIE